MPDLFEFFKDNESKLYERPSEQAWQKLQERLEARRKRRRRRIRFLQTWLVVITILILLLAAGLLWYFTHTQGE